MQTPPEKSMINNLSESNPIIFAKLSGRQELRLKLKHGEGVLGPKVNTKKKDHFFPSLNTKLLNISKMYFFCLQFLGRINSEPRFSHVIPKS